MSADSKIEWTDSTWNPLRGCSRVSPGCQHCYAERVAARFRGPGQRFEGLVKTHPSGEPRWTGKIQLVPGKLDEPLRWRRPRRIFVNSMSDLFHEGVPDEYIAAVFGVMAACPQHTFQILTKRAERMRRWFELYADGFGPSLDPPVMKATLWIEAQRRLDVPMKARVDPRAYGGERPWPLPNVWLGVSVENQEQADVRISELLQTPTAVRFLSVEPLLGPADLTRWLTELCPDCGGTGECSAQNHDDPKFSPCAQCAGPYARLRAGRVRASDPRLHWCIVGSESGPGARPMHVEWARSIVDQCLAAGVPMFTKQIATPEGRAAGDRKGGDPLHWPAGEWPRQFPEVP
jgi:protein gp37